MFRDKPYSHKVNLPVGFVMPAEITSEVRRGSKIIAGVSADITVQAQSFTFTFQPTTLAKIQGLYDHYILFDGDQWLGGEINTIIGVGDPEESETDVIIEGEQITTIEIPGLTLVDGKLQEVLTAAGQVSLDKQTVSDDKADVMEAKQVAINEAGVATDMADGAIEAKNIAVDAKNEAVAAAQSVITKISNYSANTKAAADVFVATQAVSCFIEVIADETQGGVRALYFWNTLTLQEPLLL